MVFFHCKSGQKHTWLSSIIAHPGGHFFVCELQYQKRLLWMMVFVVLHLIADKNLLLVVAIVVVAQLESKQCIITVSFQAIMRNTQAIIEGMASLIINRRKDHEFQSPTTLFLIIAPLYESHHSCLSKAGKIYLQKPKMYSK